MLLARLKTILAHNPPQKQVCEATWQALETGGWCGQRSIRAKMKEDISGPHDPPGEHIITHTPLTFAVSRCLPVDVLDDLLAAGAMRIASAKDIRRVMQSACQSYPQAIIPLLQSGARPKDAPDAIHCALLNDGVEKAPIRALVEAGANINATVSHRRIDIHGKTPLAIAVSRGWRGTAALLDLGADVHHPTVKNTLLAEAPLGSSGPGYMDAAEMIGLLLVHGLVFQEEDRQWLLEMERSGPAFYTKRAPLLLRILDAATVSASMEDALPNARSVRRHRM